MLFRSTSTKYYLDNILTTKGTEIFKKALQSLSLHIDYYESISGHKVVKGKALLNEYLKFLELKIDEYFGEEIRKEDNFLEGVTKSIRLNIYERNPLARKKCIEYFGAKCIVCNFDFENKYGEIGKGFIHVHHLIELSSIREEYVVDCTKDLVPVCPNCHAILHKKKPAFLINELKAMLK